jgi:hypothetical protein
MFPPLAEAMDKVERGKTLTKDLIIRGCRASKVINSSVIK